MTKYIIELEIDGVKTDMIRDTIPTSFIVRLYRKDEPAAVVIAEKVVT